MAFASRRFLALAAGRTAVTVLVLINVRDYFFDVHGVYGRSMTPTLSPDYHATGRQDYVLFKKYPMGAWPGLNVSRGDVVSFWKPHAPEELSVKRVIATAGDTVFPRKARSGSEGVEIPYGHVWVEGDNKAETYDSNDFGPISGNLITGRASFILRPLNRFGRVPWQQAPTNTKVVPGEALLPEELTD